MNRYSLIPILMMTVLLGSSGVCWGADYQKGFDAYEKGNYATALKEWTPLLLNEGLQKHSTIWV